MAQEFRFGDFNFGRATKIGHHLGSVKRRCAEDPTCRRIPPIAALGRQDYNLATLSLEQRFIQESAVGDPSSATPPFEPIAEDRLDSWKEIAAYLNRDVTTVQRWEKREGMPVHRHLHDKAGSVYASRSELDAWARSRSHRKAEINGDDAASANSAALPRSTIFNFPARWTLLVALAAVAAILAVGAVLWLQSRDYFWRSPIAEARIQTVTDFDGAAQAAAVSRDGQFVVFLSDRDGQMDVWVTQIGSGEFHNLTRGGAPELVNPSVRTLGFSPDGSLVTFWARRQSSSGGDIGIWAVPTLGGQPRPYLEGAAEFDWSRDGSRLAYHTTAPGDPLFVSDDGRRSNGPPIFAGPAGLHCHFPVWAPDGSFIYFVQGALPDKLNIWRISPKGGIPERITQKEGRFSFPVVLNRRTLLYLANDPDGSGPWLYSLDTERRIPHRLTFGPDRYTSLAASADGRRLIVTIASPKGTLWRLPITDSPADVSTPVRVSLTTGTPSSPRLGPNYLVYISATSANEGIWKLTNGRSAELWSGPGAQIFGGPAISLDGRHIAFSVREHGKTLLYVMEADGTNARAVADSLDLQGVPAWAPDGQSVTSAANNHGVPQLFRVPLDGGSPTLFIPQYSTDPVWTPDGHLVIYSGPDIGTTFSVRAATAEAGVHALPPLTLLRGARHLSFLPGGRMLVFLRGNIQHKDLWLIDLETGAERQLTKLAADFDIRDFDVSPDGREVVLERVQERSDVALLDIPRR